MVRDLKIINARVFTPVGTRALHGSEMGAMRTIDDAAIVITDGIFTYVGPAADAPAAGPDMPVYDAGGCAVLPGFVDSHTHLVFGGYRPDEFGWRLRGDTYMSIMERGGGIASTVKATRAATAAELKSKALDYISVMASMGVTTVEAKSGYGLDHDTEMRQLEVIADLNADAPIDVVATYMGAHAMPPQSPLTADEYIDRLIAGELPAVAAQGVAEFCDVFCERGVFSIEQSRRLLNAARAIGLKAKIHADEIVNTGGAELAAEIGAVSADHLLHISEAGIDALAQAPDTVATLLPLTAFALREEFAPARKLIDGGAAVALATDFNPGSCFSCSIPLMIALGCIYMKMTVEEVIAALTLNGASALGRAATIGSIEIGKKADLAVLKFDSPAYLPYYTGLNCVKATIKEGKFV